MTEREKLVQIVERLPEQDVPVASRVLSALASTASRLPKSMLLAPLDDEPDDDDFDGGLTEARRQADSGDFVSVDEAERILGLA